MKALSLLAIFAAAATALPQQVEKPAVVVPKVAMCKAKCATACVFAVQKQKVLKAKAAIKPTEGEGGLLGSLVDGVTEGITDALEKAKQKAIDAYMSWGGLISSYVDQENIEELYLDTTIVDYIKKQNGQVKTLIPKLDGVTLEELFAAKITKADVNECTANSVSANNKCNWSYNLQQSSLKGTQDC